MPPDGFLETLRERCDEAGALLVCDEIYCGLGRTGVTWCSDAVADVILTGKALGGGLAISAALFVRPELEAVWNLGPEDVLTHTHVGSPLACAAALIVLDAVPSSSTECWSQASASSRRAGTEQGSCARRRKTGRKPGVDA